MSGPTRRDVMGNSLSWPYALASHVCPFEVSSSYWKLRVWFSLHFFLKNWCFSFETCSWGVSSFFLPGGWNIMLSRHPYRQHPFPSNSCRGSSSNSANHISPAPCHSASRQLPWEHGGNRYRTSQYVYLTLFMWFCTNHGKLCNHKERRTFSHRNSFLVIALFEYDAVIAMIDWLS